MKKVVFLVMLVVIVSGFVACDTASAVIDNYIYENSDSYTVGGGSVSANEVNNLSISWISGAVNIIGDSNATEITLEEENAPTDEKLKMRYFVDGTVLRIRFMKSGANVLKSFAGKVLTVTVPTEKTFEEIEVENVSASCKMSGIKAVSAEIENVSGKLDVTSCEIGKKGLSLGNVSGKIEVTDCTVGEEGIEAENVSGNIAINSDVSGALNLKNVSGNIRFTGNASGKIDTENVSGDTELSLNNVPKAMDVEAVSGDIVLNLSETTPGFRLTYETSSGEFTSNVPTKDESNVHLFGDESLVIEAESTSGELTVSIK